MANPATAPETVPPPAPEEPPRGFLRALRAAPRDFWRSLFRHGFPASDRTRSEAVFHNLFLHIHPTRTHRWSLRPSFTLGLGVLSAASFLVLAVTGVLLMFY
ncbi:MAG TPA: hypothetical protein VGQ83_06065, partial [Polyangia bacterium]